MGSKEIIGTALVAAVLAAVTAAGSMASARRSADFTFNRPTLVAGTVVEGQVIIVHDDDKMAKGEACTTVYRAEGARRGKKLVEFMCEPIQRKAAEHFTARALPAGANRERLTEYQFQGDTEGHGVPVN